METQQLSLKNGKKKTGKILTITLAVALVVALGFIVWQNFIYSAPKTESDTASKTTTSKTVDNPDAPVSNSGLPDLIDYGAGVKVSTQSDLSKLTDAPASFSSYLYGTIEQANKMAETDGCTTAITVKKIYKQLYAIGGVNVTGNGCGGGYASLWGDTEGSWKQLAGSQESSFACSDLVKYKVPAAIAGAMCIDDAHPEGRSYTQE
jgi:hypothetical protein